MITYPKSTKYDSKKSVKIKFVFTEIFLRLLREKCQSILPSKSPKKYFLSFSLIKYLLFWTVAMLTLAPGAAGSSRMNKGENKGLIRDNQ